MRKLKRGIETIINLITHRVFLPNAEFEYDKSINTVIIKNGFCKVKHLQKWALKNNLSDILTVSDGHIDCKADITLGGTYLQVEDRKFV